MKNFFIICIFNFVGLCVYCQPGLPEIDDTIFVIEPDVEFYYIFGDNKAVKDSSLNYNNLECIKFGLDSFFVDKAKISIIDRKNFDDSCHTEELQKLYEHLDRNHIVKMPLLKCTDSILQAKNAKYVMYITSNGFKRSSKNYDKAKVKGIAISALTLGMFLSYPYESSQTLSICLFDYNSKDIIVYKKDVMIDSDPDGKEDVYDQISDILRRAYKRKKK